MRACARMRARVRWCKDVGMDRQLCVLAARLCARARLRADAADLARHFGNLARVHRVDVERKRVLRGHAFIPACISKKWFVCSHVCAYVSALHTSLHI